MSIKNLLKRFRKPAPKPYSGWGTYDEYGNYTPPPSVYTPPTPPKPTLRETVGKHFDNNIDRYQRIAGGTLLGTTGLGAGLAGGTYIGRRSEEPDDTTERNVLAENKLRRSLLRDYPQSDSNRYWEVTGIPDGVIGTYPESNYQDGTWDGTPTALAREGVPYGLPAHPSLMSEPEHVWHSGAWRTFPAPRGDRQSMYRHGYTPAVVRARPASDMEGYLAQSRLK